MRVENILQTLTAQFLNKKGTQNTSQPINSNEDKVEISPEARNLQKSNAVNNVPQNGTNDIQSIREEKIKEVITKMNEGYYSNPKVIAKLVDNLFDMFGI